jgi:hypothetical protein
MLSFIVLTLARFALAWFWALPPLLHALFYLCPTDWTQADVVRHIWHFPLVQPEWVNTPTLVRLGIVFLGWVSGTMLLDGKYLNDKKGPFLLATLAVSDRPSA